MGRRGVILTNYSNFFLKRNEHNQEIDEATEYLFSKVVPSCAQNLIEVNSLGTIKEKKNSFSPQNFSEVDFLSFSVKDFLHRFGVNLRYLGPVAACVQEKTSPPSSPPLFSSANRSFVEERGVHKVVNMLGLEAIARVMKNELNKKLRKRMEEITLPLEVSFCS